MYPNPAVSETTVEIQSAVGEWTLSLIGIDGRIVSDTNGRMGGKVAINTSKYAKGFYMIKLTTEENNYYKRLLIQ